MEAHSGHYHPTKENFDELLRILTEKGVDLREAKVRVLRYEEQKIGFSSTSYIPTFCEGLLER
jgi:hypothetical protein